MLANTIFLSLLKLSLNLRTLLKILGILWNLLWFERDCLFPLTLKLFTESSSALFPSESSRCGGMLRRNAGLRFWWLKLERWGEWKICEFDVAIEVWAELEKDVDDDSWRVEEEVFRFESKSCPTDSDLGIRSCIPTNLSTKGEGDRPPGWSTVPSELSLQLSRSLPFNEEQLSTSRAVELWGIWLLSINSLLIASLLKVLSIELEDDIPCWWGIFPDPFDTWVL